MRITALYVPLLALASCDVKTRRSSEGDTETCKNSLQGREWSFMRIGVRYIISRQFTDMHAPLMDLIQNRVFSLYGRVLVELYISVRSMVKPLTVSRECSSKNDRCVKELPTFCGSRNGLKVLIPVNMLSEMTLADREVWPPNIPEDPGRER
jgi:hypothetical protein